MANKINFQIGFNVDRSGLNEIKSALQQIQQQANQAMQSGTLTNELKEASTAARQLESILNSSWNSKLNQLDLSKVNTSIKNTYGSVSQLKTVMESSGAAGATAYNQFASAVLNTNLQLKQSNKWLDEMAITLSNTVRYNLASAIMNKVSSSIQQAYYYTLDLDESLNNIRIVTNKSADDMAEFAVQANKAAKALGQSTTAYTNASLIYYQQGLSDEEVAARSDITLKTANVTGQSTSEVSEELTAVWNGYKVSAEEAELYVDRMAAVAASTASDLEELSTGMSKVASAAAALGVGEDQLAAQLATIVSVTRQAPESVGTALKTIYARMSDIEAGVDEEGATLGTYSGAMAEMGINVLDANGKLRDMGEVIEEIGGKWSDFTREQQISLAQTMAGTRQYNNLIALFDNWSDYTETLEVAQNAAGTLQEQQDIYMESTAAHLQQLSTEAEKTYNILFNADAINDTADAMTGLLSLFNNYLTGLNGGINSLVHMGSVVANVFSNQIGKAISQSVINVEAYRSNLDAIVLKQNIISAHAAQGEIVTSDSAQVNKEIEIAQQILPIRQALTQEQYNELMTEQKKIGELEQEIVEIESYRQISESILNDANATTAEYQERLGYEQQFLSSYRQQEQALIRATRLYSELTDADKTARGGDLERIELYSVLNDLDLSMLQTEESREAVSEIMNALDDEEIVDASKLKQILQEQHNTISEQINTVNQLTEALQHKQQAEDGTLNKLREEQQAREGIVSTVVEQTQRQQMLTQAISGTMTIISGLTTILGAIKTANNENLTIAEKTESIITSLLVSLPMIISNFKNISQIVPGLATGISSLALKIAGLAGVELKTTTVTTSLSVALGMFKELLLGPVGIALGATLLAVSGVVAVIWASVKAYNADADAAEAAAEQVENLTDRYNELNEAASNLKDTISDYDDAIDALADLDKRTDEYAESLEEANEKAKELIETYGLFDDWSMKNGLITINQDALDSVLAEAEDKVNNAVIQKYLAQIKSNQAELTSSFTNTRRSIGSVVLDNSDPYYDGTDVRTFTNDEIEEVSNAFRELKSQLGDSYDVVLKDNDALEQNLLNLGSLSDIEIENIDAIIKNKDAFDELVDSINKTIEANNYYAEQLLSQTISSKYGSEITAMATDEEGNVDTAFANQLVDIITKKSIQDKADSGDLLEDKISGIEDDIKNVTSKNDKLQAYLRQTGYIGENETIDNESLIKLYAEKIQNLDIDNTYKAKSNWRGTTGTLTSGTGEKVIDKVSLQTMREALAYDADFQSIQQEYADSIVNTEDNFVKSLQTLVSSADEMGRKYNADFTSAIINSTSDFEASGEEGIPTIDFSDIFSDISANELEELFNMSADDLYEAFGGKEALSEIGFASAEDFQEAFQSGFVGWEWNIEDAVSSAMSSIDDEIDALGLSKAKTSEYKDEIQEYAEYIMQTAEYNEDFADSLSKDADAAVTVANAVVHMNKAIDTLADNIDDWSSVLKKSSKSSQEFGEALSGVADALGDIFGIDSTYIDSDFITSNLAEIEKAATGDEVAIESLRESLTNDIVVNIVAHNELDENMTQSLMNDINNLLDNIPDSIEIGTSLDIDNLSADEAKFMQAMQEIINSAQLTVDQANALFGTMGFDVEFETAQIPVERTGHQTVTTTEVEEWGEVPGIFNTQKYPKVMSTKTTQGDPYTYTEYVEAVAMSTDKSGSTPKIKGITRKANSSYSNYSSKNSGGKSPGTSKSSSGSSSNPDRMDKMEEKDEIDIFHDINLQIKALTESLNRLQKQEEKLTGKDLINNLNKQLEVLEKQKAAYKTKIELAKQEMAELQQILALQGITFDDEGYISNYTEVMQAKLNYLNDLIAQYNAMSKDEQSNFKDTIEQAKTEYEEFKKRLDEYDELISQTIPELEDSIQDAINQEIEINIEKFTMEIEIRLDMSEAERDFNEFQRKVLNQADRTNPFKDADELIKDAQQGLKDYESYFNTAGTGTGSIQKLTEQVNSTMDQIRQIESEGWASAYGDDKVSAMEDLQKYYEELMTELEDIVDLVDEIKDTYLDMIDEATDAFEKQVDQYEYILDLIDHDMNVIGLLYGDTAYAQMANYYSQMEQNNNKELDFLKKRVAYAKEMMDIETDAEAKEKWEEEWETALSELNDAVEDAVQNLIDKYTNSINQIFDELNKKVTSGLGLDYVDDEWDLINKNADQYLDTINSLYAIQELESKYVDAINDYSGNITAQQKLNSLMDEQISMLQTKDKLTQYDVDRANALYEIALKEIALQEAQQNKSSMRLRRDSQGNYSYQFVADEDSIAQAQQDLLAVQNSLYNLDKDQYKENLDEIYEYYVEFQEKYVEIMTDMSLTDEERLERTKLLQEQYGDLINGLVEQNEEIRQNLQESTFISLEGLYAADAESFEDMTGMNIEAFRNMTDEELDVFMNTLVPQWDSGVQHMADVFAGDGGLIPTCQDAFEQLNETTMDYQNSLDELEEAAGIDFDSMAAGYDMNIEAAQELLYANDDLILKYMEEIDAIQAVISNLNDLINEYKAAQQAAIAATEAAYAFIQAQNAANAAAASAVNGNNYNYSYSAPSVSTTTSSGASSTGSGSSSTSNKASSSSTSTAATEQYKLKVYASQNDSTGYYYTYSGSKESLDSSGVKIVYVGNEGGDWTHPYEVFKNNRSVGYADSDYWTKYDTGGYTGEWGSDGKVAMLHQKELVLNADDTKNILSAVNIVRDIASVFDNLNTNILSRLSGLISGLDTSISGISAFSDTLEQNVHIEANFPNVQSSNEIQDAFNNLVNIASQRAFSTTR
jgi:TP901 family phage tail tape measure protein